MINVRKKIERVIKNGQSRDIGNIGQTRHKTKVKKIKITQKTESMSNTDHTKNPMVKSRAR